MAKCPICLQEGVGGTPKNGDLCSLNCIRCGKYKITDSARQQLEEGDFSKRQRANLSGWVSENPGFPISTANLDSLLNTRIPSFHLLADKLLLELEKETQFIGQYLQEEPLWLGITSSINREELVEILEFLQSSNRISKDPPHPHKYKITPDGWAHLAKLREANPTSTQCFVAMLWATIEREPKVTGMAPCKLR